MEPSGDISVIAGHSKISKTREMDTSGVEHSDVQGLCQWTLVVQKSRIRITIFHVLGQVRATYSVVLKHQVIVLESNFCCVRELLRQSREEDNLLCLSSCMYQKTLTRDNEDIPFRASMYNCCVGNVYALK